MLRFPGARAGAEFGCAKSLPEACTPEAAVLGKALPEDNVDPVSALLPVPPPPLAPDIPVVVPEPPKDVESV